MNRKLNQNLKDQINFSAKISATPLAQLSTAASGSNKQNTPQTALFKD